MSKLNLPKEPREEWLLTEPSTVDEKIQKPFLDRILLIDTEKNIMGGESDRNAFVLLGTPQELINELSTLFNEQSNKVHIESRIEQISDDINTIRQEDWSNSAKVIHLQKIIAKLRCLL